MTHQEFFPIPRRESCARSPGARLPSIAIALFLGTVVSIASAAETTAETATASTAAAAGTAAPQAGQESDQQAEQSGEMPLSLSPVAIIGSAAAAQNVPGGATFISEQDLEKFEFTDIQRILRQVPGVSIQLEDGFGLRPNISIRGTPTDRSSRITLLEDGVLIAPAPYSAPAAYYFPTAGRLQGVEVLKGPAAILEGPYTTGGAINMLSTRIPDSARGQVTLESGSHGHLRGHAWYGDSSDQFGYVIEGHEWRSNGFQDIDRSSRDTGLDKGDYMARFRINTPSTYSDYHALELKIQDAEETSEQSYFGLTDADFKQDSNRRYGLSELDEFNSEHEQIILSYTGRVGDHLQLRASAYYNEFERAWFKTEGIDFGGSPDAQNFSRTDWFEVIQSVNRGESLGGLTTAELQGILDGTRDTAKGAIELRNNAREYESKGVQGEATIAFDTGPLAHSLRIGLRYHEDEEDRLQRQSTYTQIDGRLVLDDFGLLGNAGNRVEEAEALATWIYDTIEIGKLSLSPGVRIEDIELKRRRWETRIDRTDDPSSRSDDNLRSTRENDLTVVIPGIGARYALTPEINLIFGVHEGFSAPSSSPDVDEEESTNWEAGFRYNGALGSLEVIGFYNDFENLVGLCTASSGVNCEVGEVFRGDAARVRGVETRLTTNLSTHSRFALPFEATWTYSDAEFRSDLADSNFFGDAEKGDPIPYIPENQFYISQGMVWQRWQAYLSLNYVDEVCTFASCGPFERTDSLTTVDAAVHYDLTPTVQLFGLAQNLNEEDGIAGRQPRGARPNLDRTFIGGVRIQL
ncbi:MAG: TonB-dependent receptor [Wenzhouxiangellaceae bacterium]|nr:TonB-dependent receptor [Wenzhouxiangellaceae bacterium]